MSIPVEIGLEVAAFMHYEDGDVTDDTLLKAEGLCSHDVDNVESSEDDREYIPLDFDDDSNLNWY